MKAAHCSREGRRTRVGLLAFACAEDFALSSLVRALIPGLAPRTDRLEKGGRTREHFFIVVIVFQTSLTLLPSPSLPSPLPQFPPPLLLPSLLLQPNLKKEGTTRPFPSSGGIRDRCKFTTPGVANAKLGGPRGLNPRSSREAEQYPQRSGRREQGLRGGSGHPRAPWTGRLSSSSGLPSAPAEIRWSGGCARLWGWRSSLLSAPCQLVCAQPLP